MHTCMLKENCIFFPLRFRGHFLRIFSSGAYFLHVASFTFLISHHEDKRSHCFPNVCSTSKYVFLKVPTPLNLNLIFSPRSTVFLTEKKITGHSYRELQPPTCINFITLQQGRPTWILFGNFFSPAVLNLISLFLGRRQRSVGHQKSYRPTFRFYEFSDRLLELKGCHSQCGSAIKTSIF